MPNLIKSPLPSPSMRICILYSGEGHFSFLNNLFNICNVCDYCTHCRPQSLNFTRNLYGIFHISPNLPQFIEDPHLYLPTIPECDLVIAFHLHPDLLLELPEFLSKSKARAVIIPADAPEWLQPGLRNQFKGILEDHSIEYAFPRPYCSLDYAEHHPFINQVISEVRIGKPLLEIEIKKDIIYNARCVRSAPCGSTWYICEKLRNVEIDDVVEAVAGAHHSYPCNASMAIDPEIKDTLLHKAGYIVREAVFEALRKKGIDLQLP